MKSIKQIFILSIIAAATISGGAIAFVNHQVDKDHTEAINTALKESKYDIESYEALKLIRIVEARKDYSKDVATMTYNAGNMIASKERTDFTNHVLAVIKDDVITDDEFNALKSELKLLSLSNRVRKIQKNAMQIVPNKEG